MNQAALDPKYGIPNHFHWFSASGVLSLSMSIPSKFQPPSSVFSQIYSDPDQLCEAATFSRLKATQYSSGKLEAQYNILHLDNLQFAEATINKTLKFEGEKKAGCLQFMMVQRSNQMPYIAHGFSVTEQDIFGFDPNRLSNGIMPENSRIMIGIVNSHIFDSLIQEMGYECFKKNFLSQNCIRLEQTRLQTLRGYYQEISWILGNHPSFLSHPQIQSLIEEDFYPLLIDTLGKTSKKKRQRIKMYRRYSLVKKAEEIVKSYIDQPLTLKQLCNELEASSSALCYGFQDIFGMSPMAYVKTQRLNGVRRALKNANPETTKVMSIAQQWGFWSPNHFSVDYKKMFGESPSETLKKHSGKS